MDDTAERPLDPSGKDFREAQYKMGLSQEDLWARYFSLGGWATLEELEGYLEGILTPAPHEYDIMVQALNERSMELGSSMRLPYSDDP